MLVVHWFSIVCVYYFLLARMHQYRLIYAVMKQFVIHLFSVVMYMYILLYIYINMLVVKLRYVLK